MAPRSARAAANAVAVLAAAFALGCHGGAGPWSAGTATKAGVAPATHAEVRTLNEGYDRARSVVLVREIDAPTRANLDYAAYHANFMITDPPPEGAGALAGATRPAAPFRGLLEAATLTGDVGRTPLTADERARPLAFAPLVEALSAHKVAGAGDLEDVGVAVRGESWGLPGGPQLVPQIASELFVHAASPPELWVKIEFQPWFKALGALPDQDGDGFPEIYGRVTPASVNPAVLAFVSGDYTTKPLSPAEIKTWANQLSGYWYPSYNTDLVPPGARFPSDTTEADVKAELRGRAFDGPTIVVRGKPQGKPTYDVFIVKGQGTTAAAKGSAPAAPALPKTRPSPRPGPVLAAIDKELATTGGGSWNKWAASVAPFGALVRGVLGQTPASVKGIAGTNGFLFFRNSLEYVVGGDLEKQAPGKNPLPVIVDFKKQLEARGVDFLFVPVPTKDEIFPEEIDGRGKGFAGRVVNPWERKLLADLGAAGVETIDLLPPFLAAREPDKVERELVFQHQDTHWTDRGLRLAARLIAARIKEYPWYAAAAARARVALHAKETTFTQAGDLRSRLPAAEQRKYKQEKLVAHQVMRADGTPYDDDPDSPIVVLGDSFTGVYELMAPEHAGVSAHLALDLALPVDLVMSYGGGPNVRQKLLRRGAEALATKKLVVWIMTARDLFNYFEDWKPLELK
jgi:alginate O-acetyltransferase complex protein AlgJ